LCERKKEKGRKRRGERGMRKVRVGRGVQKKGRTTKKGKKKKIMG